MSPTEKPAKGTALEMSYPASREGRVAEVNDATYVEAARRGGHRWWRYLLGLAIILVSWLAVGYFASLFVAFALGGQEGVAAFRRLDYSALGPFGSFLVLMAGFPPFLAGVHIAVVGIHRRHPRTLVTARETIRWRRVGQGFVAWFVPGWLVLGLGQYLVYPDTFSFTPDLATFALFVPLALILTAIQTTTEELFFRGYVVQGVSLVWANRVFLALVAAVIFTLPHLLNPEASVGGWLVVFLNYFLGPGLVWTVVSLVDGTTELAIGAHFANNIGGILLVNSAGTVVTTPALFTVSEYHATFGALATLMVIPLFLAIFYKLLKRVPHRPGSRRHRRVVGAPVDSRKGVHDHA